MSIRITTMVAAVAAAVALGACGGDDSDAGAGSAAATTDTELTKVTMVQEWPVADGFWIPWTLGKQKGYYEQAGIDLEIVAPPTVADTMKYLGTGRADVAFTTIMDVVFAKEQGAPVVGVGRYTDGNNWGLLTKEGEPIAVEELKGKTIGIYNDAWTKAQLGIMLADSDLTLDDVETVAATDDTVPLLLQNKVDAITGVTNAEGTGMVTAGDQTPEFLPAAEHGVPNSPVWMFAANQEWLADNPELAQKFMDATEKSLEYAIEHPEEGVDAYFEAYSKAYDRDFITQQWSDTIELFEKSPNGSWFAMDDEMWTPLLDVLGEQGVVEETLPVEEYYTNELVGG